MYRDVTSARGVGRATIARGVGRATIAAGPVFLLAVALFTAAASLQPVGLGPVALAAPLLAIPAAIVGAVLALVPNILGAALLAHLGRANVGLRLPAAWALVGGGVAGAAAAWLQADATTVAALAATGAICALLCRSGTRWPE